MSDENLIGAGENRFPCYPCPRNENVSRTYCLGKCYVTSVREWCNGKPVGTTEEFIHIDEFHVGDPNRHVLRLLVVVESTLLQPLEIVYVTNPEATHVVEYVPIKYTRRTRRSTS